MHGGSSEGVKRKAHGEAGAADLLATLYAAYAAPLRSYLIAVLKSHADAEDVMQDAFLRLHRCEDLAAYASLRAVLYKTAYRLALNLIRKRRSNILDRATTADENVIAAASSQQHDAEEALIATEQDVVYAKALAQLSPRCRQVIELRTVHELSFKEISDTTGLSISTLEKHLTRGKRQCVEVVAGWHAAAAAA